MFGLVKVFVAGATGAIGRRLVPALLAAGHEVTGMTRRATGSEELERAGARAAVADALDGPAVLDAVASAAPEVVVHELTAIPSLTGLRGIDRAFASTNRLRTEGTDHLVAAARAAGVRRLVAQSFCGWPFAREGGPVKDEDAPLDPDPPPAARAMLDAIRHLESAVLGADGLEGVVLRYGLLYGPGTSVSGSGEQVEAIRRRRFPLVRPGTGIWSWVHVDDAAGATVLAVERGAPGIYQVVDDEPAPVSEWLPALASAVEAHPPRRVPTWVARLAGGPQGVVWMNEIRGGSNARAKRELGWELEWPSWRQGFRDGLG